MTDPQIICVVGTRHSGSTLLDMLMSTHPQVFGVGEAKMFALRPDTNCTCGADRWQECPFWTRVDRRMRADGGPGVGDPNVDGGGTCRMTIMRTDTSGDPGLPGAARPRSGRGERWASSGGLSPGAALASVASAQHEPLSTVPGEACGGRYVAALRGFADRAHS